MYQFIHSLGRYPLLLSCVTLFVFLTSCDKLDLTDPVELTTKQKAELQLTSGAAKSWSIEEADIVEVELEGVSVKETMSNGQYMALKAQINSEISSSMNEIVFTLVGKYETRDMNNNITGAGTWLVSEDGTKITLTPNNDVPVEVYEFEVKETGKLKLKQTHQVMANVDNDPEEELVNVSVEAAFN